MLALNSLAETSAAASAVSGRIELASILLADASARAARALCAACLASRDDPGSWGFTPQAHVLADKLADVSLGMERARGLRLDPREIMRDQTHAALEQITGEAHDRAFVQWLVRDMLDMLDQCGLLDGEPVPRAIH